MMKKKKYVGGRPTKRTATTVRKLEEAFSMGCSVTEAALFANISRETLYEWMRSDPEFSDRLQELKHKMILQARKVICDEIEKGNVRLSKWYLERKCPKEFSWRYLEQEKPKKISKELSLEDRELVNRALSFAKRR